jgi:hypothetical protein
VREEKAATEAVTREKACTLTRKRRMEWVGSWPTAGASAVCPTANERLMSGWTRSLPPAGFVFVERTKTWTMMPPHIHETNQYLKSQTPCHTDHTHVLK